MHVTRKTGPTIIGNGVTIGHSVLLHACTLEDDCFIGMHSTVMDGAVVESGAWVAAGAVVTPGKRVLKGQIMGQEIQHVTCAILSKKKLRLFPFLVITTWSWHGNICPNSIPLTVSIFIKLSYLRRNLEL